MASDPYPPRHLVPDPPPRSISADKAREYIQTVIDDKRSERAALHEKLLVCDAEIAGLQNAQHQIERLVGADMKERIRP